MRVMGPMSSKEQPSDHSIMGDGPTRSTACASTTFWRCSQRWLALAAVCRATRRPQRPPTPPAAVCTGDEYLGNKNQHATRSLRSRGRIHRVRGERAAALSGRGRAGAPADAGSKRTTRSEGERRTRAEEGGTRERERLDQGENGLISTKT